MSEQVIELSQRSHFYTLLDAAIASRSPSVHAPAAYTGDLDLDVLAYVEANRTEENGLWTYRDVSTGDIVIAGKRGAVLTIEMPSKKEAA